MTTTDLRSVAKDFQGRILGMPANKPPDFNKHRQSSGTLNGKPFHSDMLKEYLPKRTGHVFGKAGLTTISAPMGIEFCIEKWSKDNTGDFPVVVVVGINCGFDKDRFEDRPPPDFPFEELNVRTRLEEVFALAMLNISNKHAYNGVPEPDKYHLIAVYLYPYSTHKSFPDLHLRALEETLLLYGYGYSDPLNPLIALLDALLRKTGNGTVPWVVFHGSTPTTPITATRFAQQRREHGPDVLICDELCETRLLLNSVVLCRPDENRNRDTLDVQNVDE